MTVLFVITYDITDTKKYAEYNPGSNHITLAAIAKHGGEILAASADALHVNGKGSHMKVIIKFPNKGAALAWHDDEEYASAKAIRLSSTENIESYIVDHF